MYMCALGSYIRIFLTHCHTSFYNKWCT